MQPYFFPYLGYFQLIRAADVFVFHDDVQYIKGGWVNRNRISLAGNPRWLTLPVQADRHDRAINERFYLLDRRTVGMLLRRVEAAYRAAPGFDAVYPLVRDILGYADANVARFNINLVRRLCRELKIDTPTLLSSEVEKDTRLAGQARVIDLCTRTGAARYVNPIGGRSLYNAEDFGGRGLQLQFLETPEARRSPGPFSIIDMLMLLDPAQIAERLANYTLVPG